MLFLFLPYRPRCRRTHISGYPVPVRSGMWGRPLLQTCIPRCSSIVRSVSACMSLDLTVCMSLDVCMTYVCIYIYMVSDFFFWSV